MESGYIDKSGVPEPGWSDRVDNPEILAGVERKRNAARVRWFLLFVLALALLPAVSHFTGEPAMGESVKIGCVLAALVLLMAWMNKHKGSPYEGVVTAKKENFRHNASRANQEGGRREYVTHVERSDGGKERIKEGNQGERTAWAYLKVGDRFRYHPQFPFPYELYDKAKADHLFCAVCKAKNPVEADRCRRCHVPLLK